MPTYGLTGTVPAFTTKDPRDRPGVPCLAAVGRQIRSKLTLRTGSSPADSQASSLMSCLFQGCCLAPEGPARPQEAVRPPRASEARAHHPERPTAPRPRFVAAVPHGNAVACNGHTACRGHGAQCRSAYARTSRQNGQRPCDFWLTPGHAYPPGVNPSGVRRAQALFCQSDCHRRHKRTPSILAPRTARHR